MPGPDIYGFNAQFKGIGLVTAREMILTVGGTSTGSLEEYLVQNVNINYSQPIQTIRELSTGNGYFHALPPQGVCGVGRIVGTKSITSVLGNPGTGIFTAPNAAESTNTDSRTVSLRPIDGASGPTYILKGCIIENFEAATDANGSLVQERVQIRFGLMEVIGN